MPYLNVVEVESALAAAAASPYTGITQLFTLPNMTWQGRQCHGIKIANGSGGNRPGVYFLGGIHSREWGSCDILINFVEQLEQAYHTNSSLTFGSKTFSAADIQTIVNTLDIIVFPQANPDGRNYSMNTDALWRKNMRTQAPNQSTPEDCMGVDVNRNFDLLWNFPEYFSSSAPIEDSTNPCDYQLFDGPSAFSEPETQNAKWVFDNFPNIQFFIDLHSYSQLILYSWGDDLDQSTNPSMNFMNPAYNGMRGLGEPSYGEYIPSDDKTVATTLANVLQTAIQAFRGTSYTVEQSFQLYPTAGTSDDYAYSRHFVDPGKQKVIAFTIEWGTEFQPAYSEMQNIIQENTCGLLAFCDWIRRSITDCVVITDRSSFGKDEIQAMLHQSSPAVIDAAFYVYIDGFAANELGITAATFSGTPNVYPSIGFSQTMKGMTVKATACSAADESNLSQVQRFTWTYQVIFSNTKDFTGEDAQITMTASMTSISGIGVSGQAVIDLTTQPDPYEIDGPTSWLSVDLQVFSLIQNGSLAHTPSIALTGTPNEFIHNLLANTSGGYNDPTLPRAPGHPFDLDLVANENTSTVELAGSIGGLPPIIPGIPVYNFAVARVRYRALSTPAKNVRVFFRLFQAASTTTAYEPSTTYPTGGEGSVKIPLLGVQNGEVVTIPFFAAARVNPNNPQGLNAQTDPDNVGPVGEKIPDDPSGNEVQVYFGCWLDINQTTPQLPDPNSTATAAGPYAPVQSIQDAIRGKHECLVAEIHLDPPEPQIPTGITPALSDKLAQRNLEIVGVASPHLVPQTFQIKPTSATLADGQRPDELMFDWSGLPSGTSATVYLPGTSADTILQMANRMYTYHSLSRVDAHTLTCAANGITYVPIPPGVGPNYAGLLTVDVPASVTPGQSFRVLTRQITNASERIVGQPPPPQIQVRRRRTAAAAAADEIEWRKVLGSFQLSIPVQTKTSLLVPEERLLSVMRWIFKGIPHHNRWHPVIRRYIEIIAGRVISLGGDPTQILPTPSGNGGPHLPPPPKPGEHLYFTGKISGLIFDHFGDFDGFILETMHGEEHRFNSREKDVAMLVERAWRERLRITVTTEHHEPHRPHTIIIHEPPVPF
jgi:murein tripeptide amidase MpaA